MVGRQAHAQNVARNDNSIRAKMHDQARAFLLSLLRFCAYIYVAGLNNTVPVTSDSVFSARPFPAAPGPLSFVCNSHGHHAVITTSTRDVAKAT